MSGQQGKTLDDDIIRTLLKDLGQRLHDQGLVANLQVVGGAAIALTLKDGRVTMDVDALVSDHQDEFRSAAEQVAIDHGIQLDWISDDISDFVSEAPEGYPVEITYPGINVFVASPEHLLAMKVRAATSRMEPKDSADLVFLARHLGLESPEEIAELTQRQFRGIYRDSLGFDEYVETAQDAFILDDISRGIDPSARLEPRPAIVPAGSAPSIDDDWDPYADDSFDRGNDW